MVPSAAHEVLLAMRRPKSGLAALVAEQVHLRLNQLAAALLLLMLGPLMLVIAAMIARKDGAPVLFGHYRVGHQGRLFRCLKFRSMYRNSEQMLAEILATDPEARAEWERDQKLTNDPRVTPIGDFLRRTSLDELPQLINVLKGDMSLVGPRPEVPRYVQHYPPALREAVAANPDQVAIADALEEEHSVIEPLLTAIDAAAADPTDVEALGAPC